jgi:hypothetical protein
MNGNGNGATTLAYLRGEKDLLQERERLEQARKQLQRADQPYGLNRAQQRRIERFWQVASLLQGNSRMSLTEMAKRLKVPVSTIFDTIKEVEKHFHFTIVPKDRKKEASGTFHSPLEFTYQITIDPGEKKAENTLKK